MRKYFVGVCLVVLLASFAYAEGYNRRHKNDRNRNQGYRHYEPRIVHCGREVRRRIVIDYYCKKLRSGRLVYSYQTTTRITDHRDRHGRRRHKPEVDPAVEFFRMMLRAIENSE